MIHFKESEFTCPCKDCTLTFNAMDEDVIQDLDLARGHAQVPFKINSSIRCQKHNLAVGGSKLSSHLVGLAIDIACPDSYHRSRILHGLNVAGFNRIGIGKNFIHADKDEDKPCELCWTYF